MTGPAREDRSSQIAICDAMRAGAAVLVLVAHARSFVLLDVKDQPALSGAGRLFYAVTALGHQAVMVFFVVSGFLIAAALFKLKAEPGAALHSFATARLSRLWTVLVPCLLLGACLDAIGLRWGDQLVYAGHYGVLRVTDPPVPIRLDLATFVGNGLFLQTMIVPTFGSNTPLWSLANEAWYYSAAFVAWSVWRSRSVPHRAALYGALLIVIGVVLTPDMRRLAPTWALGAGLAIAFRRFETRTGAARSPRPRAVLRQLAVCQLPLVMGSARVVAAHHLLAGDYAVACSTALCFWVWRDWNPRSSSWFAVVRRTAHASYSLYLAHFPLLVCLSAVLLRNERRPFGFSGLALFAGSIALAAVLAAAVWWCFERHTGQIRTWMSGTRPQLAPAMTEPVPAVGENAP